MTVGRPSLPRYEVGDRRERHSVNPARFAYCQNKMAGKPGRSGRIPFELTERAKSLVEKWKLLDIAAGIATSSAKDADRLNAIRFLVEYGYGKVTQPVSVPSGQSFTLTFGHDGDRD